MHYNNISKYLHSKDFTWLLSKPLRAAVLLFIQTRVNSTNTTINEIAPNEFTISRNDYMYFGLKPSQNGQVRKVIEEFVTKGLIVDTHRMTATSKSKIYALNENEILTVNFQKSHKT